MIDGGGGDGGGGGGGRNATGDVGLDMPALATTVLGICWSPTGQRFAYTITRHQLAKPADTLIETRDLQSEQHPTVVVSDEKVVTSFINAPLWWLPDGRLIYSLAGSIPNERESDLWAIKVDPSTGKPRGDPEQLTNWAGFLTNDISAAANGKRLVVVKSHSQDTIYIAPLGTNRFGQPEPLVTDTWAKSADAWTPDSRAVPLLPIGPEGPLSTGRIFTSRFPNSLFRVRTTTIRAKLSAKGLLLLYTAHAKADAARRLMSVPAEGGEPSVLARGNSDYDYECAASPAECWSWERGNDSGFALLGLSKARTSSLAAESTGKSERLGTTYPIRTLSDWNKNGVEYNLFMEQLL